MNCPATRQTVTPAAPDPAILRFGVAPRSRPLLGHLREFRGHPWGFLSSLPDHGDLVRIRLGTQTAYVTCHPALAGHVLTDFRTFDRIGPAYDRVRARMGRGLVMTPHAEHRRQRRQLQPAFRPRSIPGYAPLIQREIQRLANRWQDGQTIDLVQEMFSLSTGVTLQTLFSSRLGRQATTELRECFETFLWGTITQIAFPALRHLPTPGNRRYKQAVTRWRTFVNDILHDARTTDRATDRVTDRVTDRHDRQDVLALLLSTRDENGEGLTDQELTDQIAVLLLAGVETTSAALVWSFHLLDRHPAVLDDLHSEVDTILAGRAPTTDDLPRLDLTTRVVKEALRLYPPAWFLARFAAHDTTLAGTRIPKGSLLVISPYILHRRPDTYPEPDRFVPDRWHTQPGTSYMPFATGPTRCLGETFALTETTLALATITTHWRLHQDQLPTTPLTGTPRAVLIPRTLPVRVTRR